jgi:hypothetical protein
MQTTCASFRPLISSEANSDLVIADTFVATAVRPISLQCDTKFDSDSRRRTGRVFLSAKRSRPQLRTKGSLVRQSVLAIALFALLGSAMPLASQAMWHSGSEFQQPGPADILPSDCDLAANFREFPTNPASASSGTALANFTSADERAPHSITNHASNGLDPDCEDKDCPADSGFGHRCCNPGAPTRSNAAQETVSEEDSQASRLAIARTKQRHPDFNRDIYYRNRLEFGLDVGWHPINIPFVYDFAVGDSYNMTPLKYTLVPIIASLRWHVTNVGWRWIFRGNMDFTFSGSITAIPRGPETHYYSFMFGIRRNFVYRNWKLVPFFEQRGGAGMIDAKEPLGVLWAQGQNLTFTYNVGAGVRYNLNSKYSFSGGMNYMHISNGYLSEPQFLNYGINVYGPMFGMNVRLGKPRHHDSE